MRNPICLYKSLWRSWFAWRYVSGCDSKTVEGTPDNIHIIKCTRCGKESLSWSHESLEEQK